MATEGFKILLKHATTRLCKPKHISSLSSNITITPFSLGNILKKNDMHDFYPKPEGFGFTDNKDRCFEEYFRELMDRQDETNEKIKEIWNSMSEDEKKEAIENAMQNSSCECGSGEGKSSGFKEFDNSDDAMKDYFDPNSTSNKDWGENTLLEADVHNLVNDNKNKRTWGNIGGTMLDKILSAHTPKISWKEIVRRFNKSVISMRRYRSRMKINRRYDLAQPGQRREYDTNIIFAIDSSGSMTNDDIAEGLAVINSICGHAKITYILFDTAITSIQTDFRKAKDTFEITGRGGTDFQEVVDYADKLKVDGLVIFTDGYASCPTQPLKAKVMWLLHSKDQGLTPPHGCTWGHVAYLERYE